MKKTVKKIFKVLGIVLGVILLVLIAYIFYLYASYHRIEDNLVLEVESAPDAGEDLEGPDSASARYNTALTTGETYSALTYNLGFGAYTPDFSFFMDGGRSSWAKSKESVQNTIQGAGELIASYEPDFALLQEVDLDSTRSYHVNEYSILKTCLSSYNSVFAQNYDSAFLFYPFTRYLVTDSLRRSFPVSTSFSKFFDLDRCYSISRLPVDNGKELVIFELHMSAYGNSDAIREGQIRMLADDMQKEYEAGNYVLCGGDFNHDLKASEDDSENRESWAYPFPRASLPDHFSFCIDQLTDEERDSLWNSARNADMEYVPGETYTVTLDGFIISDNIECVSYDNINTGYTYSDHDPVYLEFTLK